MQLRYLACYNYKRQDEEERKNGVSDVIHILHSCFLHFKSAFVRRGSYTHDLPSAPEGIKWNSAHEHGLQMFVVIIPTRLIVYSGKTICRLQRVGYLFYIFLPHSMETTASCIYSKAFTILYWIKWIIIEDSRWQEYHVSNLLHLEA